MQLCYCLSWGSKIRYVYTESPNWTYIYTIYVTGPIFSYQNVLTFYWRPLADYRRPLVSGRGLISSSLNFKYIYMNSHRYWQVTGSTHDWQCCRGITVDCTTDSVAGHHSALHDWVLQVKRVDCTIDSVAGHSCVISSCNHVDQFGMN